MAKGIGEITESQIDGLKRIARVYRSGEIICLEGEPTRDLLLLMQGAVEVLQGEQLVKTIRGQQIFLGHMAFFAAQKRTATLRAKTQCEIVRIREERIEQLLAAMPSLSIRLLRDLAEMFMTKETELSKYREYGAYAHHAHRAQGLSDVVEAFLPSILASLLVPLSDKDRMTLATAILDGFSSHIDYGSMIFNRIPIPKDVKKADCRKNLQDALKALMREKSLGTDERKLFGESKQLTNIQSGIAKIESLFAKRLDMKLAVGADKEWKALQLSVRELKLTIEQVDVTTAETHYDACMNHARQLESFSRLQSAPEAFRTLNDALRAHLDGIAADLQILFEKARDIRSREQIFESLRFEI
ncbi:MAG: cyclic nucleotide-binding domain-containing protein [Myxococcota bacterium]|nr:cyclic nucleotide-binding domain-containing protein [Myxococcota bacterium]